jgi:kynureninase
MPEPITKEHVARLDADDPLASRRALFHLPDGVIYLDGNSLGAMPKAVAARLRHAVEHEWANGLIRSWNDAGWYPAPRRTGAKLAPLIGAEPDEVVVADSTSVNLFKVLVAGARMRAQRRMILSERGDFPTDVYIAQGAAELLGMELRCVDPDEVLEAIDDGVAIVLLTHVNYRTARIHDMAAITRRAHDHGALAVWDLCHTAGAMPCDLKACDADFAVGCGYKYLNGGPGAPAFVFVARRHQPFVQQPLTGWHGHARPFDFDHHYAPAPGVERMLAGTAPQLALIALEQALEAFDGVDMRVVRRKSERMTDLFVRLVDQELDSYGFGLASPRDAALRGSQVSLTHPDGYAIMQALIARGVIGDFRAPDILRFGFAVLYVRFVDVWNAVATLKAIMETKAWQDLRFRARRAVT